MRRAVAVTVALAAVAQAAGAGAGTAPDADGARARRAALIVEAAELTDQLEAAQAAVVAGRLRLSRAEASVSHLRSRVRARAVNAYVGGTGAAVRALGGPRVYLEVAAGKERALLARFRSAAARAVGEERQAEASLAQAVAAAAELDKVRAELDAVIAVDDARRAERLADEARRAALDRQSRMAATARGRRAAGPGPAVGSAPASPLDPDALAPRHKEATRRQLALMARFPFGPLPADGSLPAGLAFTGQTVVGEASWYGPGFNGRPTASGAIYDQEGWTVASPELPLGTFLVVTRGPRRVLLLVNDRGPYVGGRVLDLSAAAARALGIGGVAPVAAQVVAAR